MDILIWRPMAAPGYCGLTDLNNVPDSYELKQGISRLSGFPSDAFFEMDPTHPKDVKLADCVFNLEGLIVVSKRLKEFVQARTAPDDVEFLQLTIFNHKRRVASDTYFIVNPLHVHDCIDVGNSEIQWNNLDSASISACTRLVLRQDSLDEKLVLFRPRHLSVVVMTSRSLATEVEAGGFTGSLFQEVDEFEL